MAHRSLPVQSTYSYLYSIDAVAPDDVWAVGLRDTFRGLRGLTLHWDGTSWRNVPAADGAGPTNVFYDVSAAGPDDVWAVGYQEPSAFQFKPLVEHWDGVRWSVVPPEPTAGDDDFFNGVTALSSTDAWAVGSTSGDDGLNAMTQHWDGSTWRLVAAQTLSDPTVLYDVSAGGPNDVWAVGKIGILGYTTLTEHWNGASWEVVPSPSPGTNYSVLYDVDAISASNVWAAGQASGAPRDLLVEHSRGCATPVAGNGERGSAVPEPCGRMAQRRAQEGTRSDGGPGRRPHRTIPTLAGSPRRSG